MINEGDDRASHIGLFGIGLEAYWGQYAGLRERLEGYQRRIRDGIAAFAVDVIDAGLVDSPEKAVDAAALFQREEVSLVFLFVSTYALSATVLPVVQRTNAPIVVLNLQPVRAIDYAAFNALGDRTQMTGEWLAHCQACSVPEIANIFRRAGIAFQSVTGWLDDPAAWHEMGDWVEAARAAHVMADNRLGLLGHYYSGMLDIYSDVTQQSIAFGSHVEHVEMGELLEACSSVNDADIAAMIDRINAHFEVAPDTPSDEITRAARTACGLEHLVREHRLGSLAYYYAGVGDARYEDLIASIIVGCSLLTAVHVPCAGEYEVKNAQAKKIMDAFGAGGSFTEFYAMDFDDDVLLMGHDGPGHIAIAEGKPKLKPLREFHGKRGSGVSVEMSVRPGAITCLSVIEDDGGLALLVAEGEAVPGAILEIGNTNSRYRFPLDIRSFMTRWCEHGPAHHCAVGTGHIAGKIEKLGKLLGLPTYRIC